MNAPAENGDVSGDAARCTIWPLNDKFQFQVTEGQLCVRAGIYVQGYVDQPPTIFPRDYSVSIDDGPAQVFRMAGGARQKVGFCDSNASSNPGYGAIWTATIEGCVANAPTASTRRLILRRHKPGVFGVKEIDVVLLQFLSDSDLRVPGPAPVGAAPRAERL